MNARIVFAELQEPDEIRDALTALSSSLFDQTVNTPERLTALVEKYSLKAHVLTLSDDGQLVGLCAYYDNELVAFISMLVISQEKQHQGYGSVLLEKVLQRCRQKASVQLTVSSANHIAIDFYQKNRFRLKQRDQGKIMLEISQKTKNNIEDQIIEYLRRNRVSTTEVADCLGKAGAVSGLTPCTPGYYKVGRIKWIYTHDETNWPLHEQIQNIEDGCMVFIDAYNCGDRALFGQLVSKYLILYHQSEAIIVRGKLRDAAALIREKWPIWCSGYTPVGCNNQKPEEKVDQSWVDEHFQKYDGALAVCDDCGVVVIPKERINEEFLRKLHQIEEQEDIWFDRLDHYKESTFDIVCKKAYINDEQYMARIKNSSKELNKDQ